MKTSTQGHARTRPEDEDLHLADEPISIEEALPWLRQPKPDLKQEEDALVEVLTGRFRVSKADARQFTRKIYRAK